MFLTESLHIFLLSGRDHDLLINIIHTEWLLLVSPEYIAFAPKIREKLNVVYNRLMDLMALLKNLINLKKIIIKILVL